MLQTCYAHELRSELTPILESPSLRDGEPTSRCPPNAFERRAIQISIKVKQPPPLPQLPSPAQPSCEASSGHVCMLVRAGCADQSTETS